MYGRDGEGDELHCGVFCWGGGMRLKLETQDSDWESAHSELQMTLRKPIKPAFSLSSSCSNSLSCLRFFTHVLRYYTDIVFAFLIHLHTVNYNNTYLFTNTHLWIYLRFRVKMTIYTVNSMNKSLANANPSGGKFHPRFYIRILVTFS